MILNSYSRVIVTRSYESAQWGELTFVPDSAMDLNVVPGSGSWILRDQARNDVEGGGVEPIALVGEYEGLSYANLSAPYTFPPEERVTVNGMFNIVIKLIRHVRMYRRP